ncbi:MAG TPA: hypothetical protein VMU15_11785 [Anaeromyxobacter sp.]|nr:hypothetical protein [Anaeromyxobacter sp.]
MTLPPSGDPLEQALAHSPDLEDGQAFTRGVLRLLPPRRGPSRGLLLGAGAALAACTGAALVARSSGAVDAALRSAGGLGGGEALAALVAVALLGLTAFLVAAGELRVGGDLDAR